MSEHNSTAARTPDKPAKSAKPNKPYPEFPLFAHATRRWAKKIRGEFHYFGSWDDPDAALAKYLEQKDALHAGRKPRPDEGALTVKGLANRFLTAKRERVDVGELSTRTWDGYKLAADLLVDEFGKQRLVSDLAPDDFAVLRNRMARRWGPHMLGTTIQCVRCVFKYAYESELIDRPVRFGPGFARPSKKTLRLHKAKQPPKFFEAEEVRRLLDAAGVPMRAMIYLGLNCGFGNSDCGNLPLTALDLDRSRIDFPRPKTGIARRCPLWPETVAALREVLAKRREPKNDEDAGLVFVTKHGYSWGKDTSDSPITKEMRKLLDSLGIEGHRNFYALRHTFRTVADEARDQPAVDHIMGHESTHISSVYRERISDERLRAVSDYVRAWLLTAQKPSER